MRIFITAALPSALLLAGTVTGCASQPVPAADLTRAHTLVAQAQASDAPRYDSVDLTSAQDKLQQADTDAQSQPAIAGQMAQEASADAELAMARTQDRKAQESLGQVNDSLAALRQQDEQLERDNANGSAAPGAPVAPPQIPQGAQQ
jgi:hypothetical protein